MPKPHFYAAHNPHADLAKGNCGFLNSWEVSRFPDRAARDAFVEKFENRNARAVDRREARRFFRANYLSVGKTPPPGAPFAKDPHGNSYFYNESFAYETA